MQRPARGLPLGLDLLLADAPEPDAPPLEEHDLHSGLAGLVDGEPRGRRLAVAPPVERGLVVLGDVRGPALEEGGEHVAHERDVVGARLAPALHEGVVRVGGGEGQLVLVGEVEVVYADDEGLEELPLLERRGEGPDEGGLADALHAVQADYEGAGTGPGLLVLVDLETIEDWEVSAWGVSRKLRKRVGRSH